MRGRDAAVRGGDRLCLHHVLAHCPALGALALIGLLAQPDGDLGDVRTRCQGAHPVGQDLGELRPGGARRHEPALGGCALTFQFGISLVDTGALQVAEMGDDGHVAHAAQPAERRVVESVGLRRALGGKPLHGSLALRADSQPGVAVDAVQLVRRHKLDLLGAEGVVPQTALRQVRPVDHPGQGHGPFSGARLPFQQLAQGLRAVPHPGFVEGGHDQAIFFHRHDRVRLLAIRQAAQAVRLFRQLESGAEPSVVEQAD